MSNVDLLCPLCGCWIESVIHLFCDCSLAKALWFRCLDTRTKLFDLTEPSDIVELILFPSDDLKDDPFYCDHFILTGTLILDQIWKACNFKIHDDGQIKVEQIMKNIIMLRSKHRLPPKQSSNSACPSYVIDKWVRPEFGVIKINCDAAVGPRFSSLTVVAKDWRGNLVFALTKKANTNIPLQAEVEALLWACLIVVEYELENNVIAKWLLMLLVCH